MIKITLFYRKRMNKNIKQIQPFYHFLRTFVYTSIITFILMVLAVVDFVRNKAYYEIMAWIIMIILLTEAYFTVKYLKNANYDRIRYYNFSEHLITHFFYPSISFFALIFYLILQNNLLFSFIIITISSIIYFLYFYYLPFYIYYDNIDYLQHKKIFSRIDFVFYIFKFFAYFVVNLSLFTYSFHSFISQQFVILVNFFTNFLFLFFHIFRKNLLTRLNLFMAIIFSFFISLFVAITPFSRINILTSATLLYFYLASSLFYHKVDGTFNFKSLIEYSSIALIVSIFIFTLQ